MIDATNRRREILASLQQSVERIYLTPHKGTLMGNRLTDDMVAELFILTNRDEAGRHFTEWSEYHEELESLGLVVIHRPIHESGIPYSCEYWSVEITEEGLGVVDSRPELHPQ